MKKLISLALFAVVSQVTLAATPINAVISPLTPAQGDVVVVSLPAQPIATSAKFLGTAGAVFPYKDGQRVVFGVGPTQKAGVYPIKIIFVDGATFEQSVSVRARRFALLTFPVPEKLNQTPQQLVTSLGVVNTAVRETVANKTGVVLLKESFGLPLYDNRKVSSPFGELRVTGEERIRHLGIDFAGKVGVYVGAINAGTVTKAYVDPVYGNSVILDHGQGMYSLYMHMDTIATKTGAVLKKGGKVGTLGQSGYASGPHLHLSVKINGVSVDPLRLVSLFK